MRPGRTRRAPCAEKDSRWHWSRAPALRPRCTVAASGPLRLRVWPLLGCCTHSSDWVGERASPSSRFQWGASPATKRGNGACCAQGLPRVEWLQRKRIPGRAQRAKERAPGAGAHAPPKRGSPCSPPSLGRGQARRCPCTLPAEAVGSGEAEGGWGGAARSGTAVEPRAGERTWSFPDAKLGSRAHCAQLTTDTGSPGDTA